MTRNWSYCFSLNFGFTALFVEQPPALPGPILNCARLNHIVPKCSFLFFLERSHTYVRNMKQTCQGVET